MTRIGLDFYGEEPVSYIKETGASFVVRYLSDQVGKCITESEAELYARAGLDIACVWENMPRDVLNGYSFGQATAWKALEFLHRAGCVATRPIYFAIDFDAGGYGLIPQLVPFFQGAKDVLGDQVGAYGGYSVMKALRDDGVIHWIWQTSAWSWVYPMDGAAYVMWEPRANLHQYRYGNPFDWDQAMTEDFGQWRPGVKQPTPMPNRLAPLFPAERAAVNKLLELQKHPIVNRNKIAPLLHQLKIMQNAVWNRAAADGLTEKAWASNNREQRYLILLHYTHQPTEK